MSKHFYSHIVNIESITIELDNLDLSSDEKKELSNLINSNLHHAVLDTVLSELKEDDKKIFLKHLSEDEHEKIWELLKNKVEKAEEKIKKTADDLLEELRKDIKSLK